MKHILILLALVFSMASVNAQSTSSEQDYQAGLEYYLDGDYKQAFDKLLKSSNQGYAYAQFYLGIMYYDGQDVDQNYEQAFNWFLKAAEQGNSGAQYNLALMYDLAQSVDRDLTKAFGWHQKAAAQGHANAQFNLGVMYYQGLGVEQDYVLSHVWFNMLASLGDYFAQNSKDIVAKKMTPSQIIEAEDKAQKCFESKYKDCN